MSGGPPGPCPEAKTGLQGQRVPNKSANSKPARRTTRARGIKEENAKLQSRRDIIQAEHFKQAFREKLKDSRPVTRSRSRKAKIQPLREPVKNVMSRRDQIYAASGEQAPATGPTYCSDPMLSKCPSQNAYLWPPSVLIRIYLLNSNLISCVLGTEDEVKVANSAQKKSSQKNKKQIKPAKGIIKNVDKVKTERVLRSGTKRTAVQRSKSRKKGQKCVKISDKTSKRKKTGEKEEVASSSCPSDQGTDTSEVDIRYYVSVIKVYNQRYIAKNGKPKIEPKKREKKAKAKRRTKPKWISTLQSWNKKNQEKKSEEGTSLWLKEVTQANAEQTMENCEITDKEAMKSMESIIKELALQSSPLNSKK